MIEISLSAGRHGSTLDALTDGERSPGSSPQHHPVNARADEQRRRADTNKFDIVRLKPPDLRDFGSAPKP